MATQGIYEKIYDALYDEIPIGSYSHVTVTGTVANNTLATVAYDTVVSDVPKWFTASSPSDITVSFDGLYVMTGTVQFGASATGYRGMILRVNDVIQTVLNLPAISGVDIYMSLPSHPIMLSDGDDVDMQIFQNSGGTLAITAGLSVIRVG